MKGFNTAGGNIHRRFKGEYWWWAWAVKFYGARLIERIAKIWA